MRTWLLPTFLVLLLAGLGVFLFSDSSEHQSQQNSAQDSPSEEVESAENVLAASKVSAAEHGDAIDPVRTTISRPESASEIVYATPAEDGILISIVDGNTQEPLPFAEVMVIDTAVADMRTLEAEMALSPDFEKIFEHLGVIYKTDHKGLVTIPFAIDSHIIAGRTRTHFNFSIDVDENSEKVTLYLNPTQILAVKVVNSKGSPVEGAPVSLRVRNDQSAQDFTTAYSNKDGIAELKLFQLLILELADDNTYAALLSLSNEPEETKIDLKDLPEEPPILVLRDVGELEVQIRDAQGDLTQSPFLVNVDLLLPEDSYEQSEELDSWSNPREHLTGRSKNGIAHFPLVDYNQRLRVVVVSPNGELRAELYGEGPVSNGGPAIFTLIPQAENPVILGRILNTEGAIGPNLNLEYLFKMAPSLGSHTSKSGTLHTDENGRFRLLVEDVFKEGATRTLTISLRATRKKPKRSIPIDLSYSLAPGENDLGDLVLAVPPLIASGVVVNQKGEALSNAQIRLEKKQFYGEEEDQFWWNGLWEHRTKAGRDGKFEIRANLEQDFYRLAASRENYIDSSLPIVQGTEDIRLVMRRSITLKGQVLLDEDLDAELLDVIVVTPDPNREGHELRFHSVLHKSGSFTIKGLSPGVASLVVRAKNFHEVLFNQERLIIDSSNTTQTLEDINLRGKLRSLRIWVRDLRGELIPSVKIWPLKPGNDVFSNENPFATVTQENGLAFQVGAPGYQILDVPHAIGDQEIVLQDGFPIKVEIDNLHILPKDWKLRVFIFPLGENSNQRLQAKINKFGMDVEPTHLMMHGTYKLRFLIWNDIANMVTNRHLPNENNVTIEVADLPLLQTFHISLDEEAVANAVTR